ncbi:hypothetical protein [Pseudoroseicyclus aestuarii]|uniref:Uncharacterized protein n=1 Tax=Pseudoroseicyclus aestuarii TaxID=1795041 RepID=A0A318SUR1_9RHOB|nr:hypothetical protein [Pseudoroseicyclus aestuarii]PYE85651.1 hypothetical protein DFP88_101320 [Pseudoroseicyclus aestuarii]
MSAPHTDVEKQERQHRTPLVGMGLAALFGVVMIVLLSFFVFGEGETPEAEQVLDTSTGEVINTDEGANEGAEAVGGATTVTPDQAAPEEAIVEDGGEGAGVEETDVQQ